MGKGDKRTFRGKLYRGSFGNSRPKKAKKGKGSGGPSKGGKGGS